ncbi:MAG: serine acetyltransferase [Massilia sp.]
MKKQNPTFSADFARFYRSSEGPHLVRLLRCWCTPGLQAVAVFRFGQWAMRRHLAVRVVADPAYHLLNLLVQLCWGIDLPRSARIGRGLFIGHFGGVHISAGVQIGVNCNLSQGITIDVGGAGEHRGAPVIGDNAYIAPGARLFGRIRIGNNVKVGANAVIYQDIPDNAIVVLDPGFKIVSLKVNPRPTPAE